MQPQGAHIELSPHCSLSPRQARLFFSSLCAGCLGLAGFLSLQGFWPILPFAGLEMLVLGIALRLSLARRHEMQSIQISDDEVRIRSQRKGAVHADAVFPRHWARVKLSPAFTPSHPSRLTIESQGRACEVGQFLTEVQRRDLARRLARLIGRTGESPSLAVDWPDTRVDVT